MSQRKGPYAKLETALNEYRKAGHSLLPASFGEVEEWLGSPLPPSAYKHRAWWSNNYNNSNARKPWQRAGFRAKDVNMDKKTLVFRANKILGFQAADKHEPPSGMSVSERLRKMKQLPSAVTPTGMSDVTQPYVVQQSSGHHPLRGALKGVLRIVAETDLTKPADPDWADKA